MLKTYICAKKERSREGTAGEGHQCFACPEIRWKEENQEENLLQKQERALEEHKKKIP